MEMNYSFILDMMTLNSIKHERKPWIVAQAKQLQMKVPSSFQMRAKASGERILFFLVTKIKVALKHTKQGNNPQAAKF